MVWDIVRDSTFGQFIRLSTGNKFLRYPEEQANFEYSNYYGDAKHPPHPIDHSRRSISDLRPNDGLEGQGGSEGIYAPKEQLRKISCLYIVV